MCHSLTYQSVRREEQLDRRRQSYYRIQAEEEDAGMCEREQDEGQRRLIHLVLVACYERGAMF